MELMSDEALKDIADYLKKRNADIPEEESTFDKIDALLGTRKSRK